MVNAIDRELSEVIAKADIESAPPWYPPAMLIDRLNKDGFTRVDIPHEPGAWMAFVLPLSWGSKRRAAEKEASRLRALAASLPVESVQVPRSTKMSPEQLAEAQKLAAEASGDGSRREGCRSSTETILLYEGIGAWSYEGSPSATEDRPAA